MSEHDIGPGQPWRQVLAEQLRTSKIAILCLCEGNQHAATMHFEAGVVSGSFEDSARVIPYCLGIKSTNLTWPFNDFQAKTTSKGDTKQMFMAINSIIPSPLTSADAEVIFEMWWPQLEARIAKIPTLSNEPEQPSLPKMVEEILERVRVLTPPTSIGTLELGPRPPTPSELRRRLFDFLRAASGPDAERRRIAEAALHASFAAAAAAQAQERGDDPRPKE